MERMGTMEKWVECKAFLDFFKSYFCQIQTIFLKWNIYFQLKELQNFEKFIKYLARKITFVKLFFNNEYFLAVSMCSVSDFGYPFCPLDYTIDDDDTLQNCAIFYELSGLLSKSNYYFLLHKYSKVFTQFVTYFFSLSLVFLLKNYSLSCCNNILLAK